MVVSRCVKHHCKRYLQNMAFYLPKGYVLAGERWRFTSLLATYSRMVWV